MRYGKANGIRSAYPCAEDLRACGRFWNSPALDPSSSHSPATALSTSAVAALIPAYLERRHIAQVVRRTLPYVGEVLVIDDGSGDETADRAEAAGARVLRHARNQGKGAAIKTGFRDLVKRNFTHIMMLDADGQHLPEEIPRFLAEASQTDAQMILGSRMEDTSGMPPLRRLTNRAMSRVISRICRQPIPDSQCGFRLLHVDIVPFLFCPSNAYEYETEMLFIAARSGHRISSVPVSTVYADETSKIRPVRDSLRFARLVVRYL